MRRGKRITDLALLFLLVLFILFALVLLFRFLLDLRLFGEGFASSKCTKSHKAYREKGEMVTLVAYV